MSNDFWVDIYEQFEIKFYGKRIYDKDKTYNYIRRLIYSIRRKKKRMEEEIKMIEEFEKKLSDLLYGARW